MRSSRTDLRMSVKKSIGKGRRRLSRESRSIAPWARSDALSICRLKVCGVSACIRALPLFMVALVAPLGLRTFLCRRTRTSDVVPARLLEKSDARLERLGVVAPAPLPRRRAAPRAVCSLAELRRSFERSSLAGRAVRYWLSAALRPAVFTCGRGSTDMGASRAAALSCVLPRSTRAHPLGVSSSRSSGKPFPRAAAARPTTDPGALRAAALS